MPTAEELNSITLEDLQRSGTTKWNRPDKALGAFVAEMDYGVAQPIKDALHAEVDKGLFAYLPDRYRIEMQEAVAGFLHCRFDWSIAPERIHEMPDVLSAYQAAITHFSEPGSKLIIPTPAHMPFLSVAELEDREVIEVPMSEDAETGRFANDLRALEDAFDAGGQLLILCNPHNPTGSVFTLEELQAIEDLVDRKGGRVFSDEIWMPLVFSPHQHIPYASIGERAAGHTVTATAASKGFNLPGLKCAQLIISNDEDEELWNRVGFFSMHGAANLGLTGTAAAFNDSEEWLDDILTYLDGNRAELVNFITEKLPRARVTNPQGTYVAWIDLSAYGIGDDIQGFLLEKAGVLCTDGAACGEVGKGHIRFVFAMPRPLMITALERISAALEPVAARP